MQKQTPQHARKVHDKTSIHNTSGQRWIRLDNWATQERSIRSFGLHILHDQLGRDVPFLVTWFANGDLEDAERRECLFLS